MGDELHDRFTDADWVFLDKGKEAVECTCNEDIPQDQKRVIRLSLSVAADLEIAKKEELSHKKLSSKLKMKLDGATEDDLKSKEFQAAMKATVAATMSGASSSAENKCDFCVFGEAEVRRLTDCSRGRCLEATEVAVPFSNTVHATQRVGDTDEAAQVDLEGVDTDDATKVLKEQLTAVGKDDMAADAVVVSIDAPESEDTDTVPEKPETLAGEPEANVDSATKQAMSLVAMLSVAASILW